MFRFSIYLQPLSFFNPCVLWMKRNKRVDLQKRIKAITAQSGRPHSGQYEKLETLQAELDKLEHEDLEYEQSVEAVKRQKILEGFGTYCDGLKELGEKLSIVGGYGKSLLQNLEVERADQSRGEGLERSKKIRAGAEDALKACLFPFFRPRRNESDTRHLNGSNGASRAP
jgi:hypothetical protein